MLPDIGSGGAAAGAGAHPERTRGTAAQHPRPAPSARPRRGSGPLRDPYPVPAEASSGIKSHFATVTVSIFIC